MYFFWESSSSMLNDVLGLLQSFMPARTETLCAWKTFGGEGCHCFLFVRDQGF